MRIRGLVFCLFFAAIFVTFSCNSSRQKAARAKTKPVADEIASAMKEVKSPLDAETIGPLYYANIDGSPLVCIFDMEVGEAKALVDGDEYVVVQIVKSEKVPMPPPEGHLRPDQGIFAPEEATAGIEDLDRIGQ